MYPTVSGGVCAAKGFTANGVHCGIRKNKTKRDLALVVSDTNCAAACVYTQNLVKGAPLIVTKENVSDGHAKVIICNSGNANTCNADGEEKARLMCALASEELGVAASDIVIASTGVIGLPFDVEPIRDGLPALAQGLSRDGTFAAEAIMTTDTVDKQYAVSFTLGGKTCFLGGMAKGSGMIHPNMATMLVFVTTDAAITPAMLQKALSEDVKTSFNMVSIDGDTSTNDMVTVLASGHAGNPEISEDGEDFDTFCAALSQVTTALCRMIAKDGEGATKLLTCVVSGAPSDTIAKVAAKSVICSSLVKAMMFGADANFGRVLCAVGYCGEDVDIGKIDVAFRSEAGELPVCIGGCAVPFSEETAKEVLLKDEIDILVNLNAGACTAAAWGCDLTYDYVKINGDYRT